jgi:hypothetical protein
VKVLPQVNFKQTNPITHFNNIIFVLAVIILNNSDIKMEQQKHIDSLKNNSNEIIQTNVLCPENDECNNCTNP